jgi:hypothetical protein
LEKTNDGQTNDREPKQSTKISQECESGRRLLFFANFAEFFAPFAGKVLKLAGKLR